MKERDSFINSQLISQNKQDQNQSINKTQTKSNKMMILAGKNIFQSLFFTYISPLVSYGNKQVLTNESIPYLDQKDCPNRQFNTFKQHFQRLKESEQKDGIALIKSLYHTYKKPFLIAVFIGFFSLILQFIPPILTNLIIDYVQNKSSSDYDRNQGIYYFSILFFTMIIYNILMSQFFNLFNRLGYNLKNCTSLIIYQKALRYPLITQKQFGTAEIINYSQVDAERFTFIGFQLTSTLLFPFHILTIFFVLYLYIGVSLFIGIAIMIVMMVITLFLTRILGNINDELLKKKDGRMKITQQIMQIIKFIKTNAFESAFLEKVQHKRKQELSYLKKNNLMYSSLTFMYYVCTPLVISAVFLMYAHLGNQITPQTAFVVIFLFNILQFPLSYLPTSLVQLIQIWSSIKRIQKFLRSKEIDWSHIAICEDKNVDWAIAIQNGTFSWGKQKQNVKADKQTQVLSQKQEKILNNNKISQQFTQQSLKESLLSQNQVQKANKLNINSQKYTQVLHDINYKFKKGKFTMIIGDIGSGKSSLLYAILNQMTPQAKYNQKITINGKYAYVPQKPWIMSGTLRHNIIFNQKFDQNKLQKVLYYSCLNDDLKIFAQGIDTQIGQKGVNLSGGQKTRVALARALYSEKDIYLFDDIISAVDVNVGKFIIQETIKNYLKGKTIIMPTHAINYMKNAQQIIMMDKGQIRSFGSYQKVSKQKYFKELSQIQESKKQINKKQEADKKLLSQQKMTTLQVQKALNRKKSSEQLQSKQNVIQQFILPEEHKKGKVSFNLYKQYVSLNGGLKFSLGIFVSLTLWVILQLMSNIQIQNWCEDPSNSTNHLYLYLIFSVSGVMFTTTRSLIIVAGGIRQSQKIHTQMMSSLLYASIIKFYNRVPVGRILNRLSKDLKQIDDSLGMAMGDFLAFLFKLFGTLAMCVYASTPYVLFPLTFFFIFFLKLQNYYLTTQRQCVRLQNISSSPIVSGFTSAVNGVATIRAFNCTKSFMNQQIQNVTQNKRITFSKITMENWFALRLALISFIVNMSAIAYAIFSDIQNGALVGLLLVYSVSLDQDIINMIFTYAYVQTKMISIQRVLHYVQIEGEKNYECSDIQKDQAGSIPYGKIEFKNFSVKYRHDLPIILDNLCFTIEAGDKVGIVGRTGAGKSTLLNCLIRIIDPYQGQILIDDKNILSYPLKTIRSSLTVIEQEPTLFHGSFRDNLDPSNTYNTSQLKQHLIQCNLWQLIEQKGGLDTILSNDSLSAGEKQLICISRAFLKKSKIVLIDEATANIDVKSDQRIQALINSKFKESTVLTIAHRLSTLQTSDKILVLGQGKVLEWGERTQLLGRDTIFKQMCENNDKTFFD